MTDAHNSAPAGPLLRMLAPAAPYVTVLVGVYVLASAWAAIVLYHLAMALVLTATRSWSTLASARLSRSMAGRCRPMLGVMVSAAALVGPSIYAVWGRVERADLDLERELAALGLLGIPWLAFIVYYFTVNPVLEETFWRGYLGSDSRRPTVNDVLFAGYHVFVLVLFVTWPWALAASVGLVAAGWLWRQVARDCRGLTLPILSHAVADASLIIAAALLAR